MPKLQVTYGTLELPYFSDFWKMHNKFVVETEGKVPSNDFQIRWAPFVLDKMKDENHFFLIARHRKKVIGILMVTPLKGFEPRKRAMLSCFYVLPEYRKEVHIGGSMMEIMAAWLKHHAYEAVFVLENVGTRQWEKKNKMCQFKPIKKLLEWDLTKWEIGWDRDKIKKEVK